MVNMKKKSILLSLLLAIFVVGGMFAQEPTYSKMSPYTHSFRQISEERYGELVVEEFYLGRLSLGFREGGDG